MGRRIDETIHRVVPRGFRTALIDFPNYFNVGDHAIWAGERVALRRAGIRPNYVCSIDTFDRERLAHAVRDGIILLTGGGYFGDLWPKHHHFREALIAAFPGNVIVQLPQSIWFGDPEKARRTREIMREHGRVTLLVRDRTSRQIARELLGIEPVLCPDMAFALGPLKRRGRATHDVLYLKRDDKESPDNTDIASVRASIRGEPGASGDWIAVDWPVQRGAELFLAQLPILYPSLIAGDVRHRLQAPLFAAQSKMRLAAGIKLLSQGRYVVSDRLHGFILAFLLGIPVVPLDNRVGKLSSFIETWWQEKF